MTAVHSGIKFLTMTNDHDSPPHGEQGKHFKRWYQEYTAADGNDLYKDSPLIQIVNSDELDADFIEQRIFESIPKLLITKGFCIKCQDLFDNWPTLGRSSLREHNSEPDDDEEGWEHAVARSCSTYELEGATRSGCRFCAFLLQSLKDSKLLETFRKIEARLYYLDKNATSSLSVQNWGTNPLQILWLNLPSKVCTSCNSGIASHVQFDSCFLPASGTLLSQCSVNLVNTSKPIATMTLLIYSILRVTGSLLALKAMNFVKAAKACCLLG